MQFDVLKNYLEKLSKEGLIKIKVDKVQDAGFVISIGRTIKWVDKKDE